MPIQEVNTEEYTPVAYNPKKDKELKQMRSAKSFKLFQYKNPLPDQMTDPEELKKLFDKYRLIPFSGDTVNTGQSYLHLLRLLRNYSDTHGACIRSKMQWCFGGKLRIEREQDDIFEFDDDLPEVPLKEKKAYAQYVRKNINWDAGGDPRKCIQNAVDDYEWSGNCWIELVHTQTAGVWTHFVYVHQPEHCLYEFFELGMTPLVIISPNFNESYLRQYPPSIVPVYPAYKVEGNTYRTIIHEMEGNYPYYGRPSCRHGLLPMYNEFQNSEYVVKLTAAFFMGQVLVEFEDGDSTNNSESPMNDDEAQKDGYDNAMDRFEINYTNRGEDPTAAIITTRPNGTKPAFVHEFKPTTNDKHYEKTSGVNSSKIIRAHGWSARLIGDEVSNGLSTNVFLDEFSIKNVTVVREIQHVGNKIFNTITRACHKVEGITQFIDLWSNWTSPYEDLLKQKEEMDEKSKAEEKASEKEPVKEEVSVKKEVEE